MRAKILVFTFLSFTTAVSHADAYDHAKVVAVQDRAYTVNKEMSALVGVLPLDAFNKTIFGGASYTYAWKPQYSWELLNISAATNIATSLKTDLQEKFKVQPDESKPQGILDYPTSMVTTQFNYSPLYGKYLLFNEKVVHNELNFGITGGVINYKTQGAVPIVGVGMMSRYFYSPESSFKFDARLYYQFTNRQSSNLVLYFTLGYSVHFDVKKGGAN